MRSVKPLSLFVTGQFDSDSERYWPLIPTTRQTVASFRRIRWPAWLGFRGQLPSDSVASFRRILQILSVAVVLRHGSMLVEIKTRYSAFEPDVNAPADMNRGRVVQAGEQS